MYTSFQKKHLIISGLLFAYAVPRYFLQFSVLILKIIGHLIESWYKMSSCHYQRPQICEGGEFTRERLLKVQVTSIPICWPVYVFINVVSVLLKTWHLFFIYLNGAHVTNVVHMQRMWSGNISGKPRRNVDSFSREPREDSPGWFSIFWMKPNHLHSLEASSLRGQSYHLLASDLYVHLFRCELNKAHFTFTFLVQRTHSAVQNTHRKHVCHGFS